MTTDDAGGPVRRKRAKKGPNGVAHWVPTRSREKLEMRTLIADAIKAMTDFPSIAGIVEAGGGAFCKSSVRRNLDMVDAAQAAYNAERLRDGQAVCRTRTDTGRTSRQDRLLEEERERSADLARQLLDSNRRCDRADAKVERLEFMVASYQKGERDGRARQTHWNRKAGAEPGDPPPSEAPPASRDGEHHGTAGASSVREVVGDDAVCGPAQAEGVGVA